MTKLVDARASEVRNNMPNTVSVHCIQEAPLSLPTTALQ